MLRALIFLTSLCLAASNNGSRSHDFVGDGLPKDTQGNSYNHIEFEDVTSAEDCLSECRSGSYPEGPLRGYSHNSDTQSCYCWSGGSSSISSIVFDKEFGKTYCVGCNEIFKEPRPKHLASIGPIKSDALTITLFGIHKLENEKEWSTYTAKFAMDYLSSQEGNGVYDATININVVKQEPLFKVHDEECGCSSCTPKVLSSDACDDNGYCSTCGERISFVQSDEGRTEREACSQVAGLEYNGECGKCDPLTCNLPNSFCGCPECAEVWSAESCDEDGFCSTCGERITYLHSLGNTEREACAQVAGVQYEDVCHKCNPLTCNQPTAFCGCPKCTEAIWKKKACDKKSGFCSRCGERIDFLQQLGHSERDSCIQIAGNEHYEDCHECNPLLCTTGPPDSPEDISVVITYTQTSTYSYKTSRHELNTDSTYIIQKPFAGKEAQSEYISYLSSKSSDYSGVVSVSHVSVSPKTLDANGGGPNARTIIIATIACVYALAILIKEMRKMDKYDAGVAEYPPGQYPPEEERHNQRAPWQYPNSQVEVDSEEEGDDDSERNSLVADEDDSPPPNPNEEDAVDAPGVQLTRLKKID